MSAKFARIGLATALFAAPFFFLIPPAAATPDAVVGPACTEGTTTDVSVTSFAFTSNAITIDVGDVVLWTNNVPAPQITRHTTTENYLLDDSFLGSVTILVDVPLWNSGGLNPGESFSVQFCQTGTFSYHCDIHRFMRATVDVV